MSLPSSPRGVTPPAGPRTAAQIRAEAWAAAAAVVAELQLPPGTALAATGSFARRDMTPCSDLDLILIHAPGTVPEAEGLWYPVWEARYHLDATIRTPAECAAVAAENAAAGFAQLDLSYVAGNKLLVDAARAQLLAAWRRQLQKGFGDFLDIAIARWHRSGDIATMTNPDLKNGRGGLRDIQLLRALALGNLCDMPKLEAELDLLLDVRTLLHVHARRHRDTLDPEFAADIAQQLGMVDRYELSAALVTAATRVQREVERGLAVSRALLRKRVTKVTRRPLDIDVIDAGGVIDLSRKPDLADPWLVARVGAASARTGLPVAGATWGKLAELPTPQRWTRAAVSDFYAILSAPQRVIGELDAAGLWERFVPDWQQIRGLLPRERNHIHSVEAHTIAVVAEVARRRTTVARPDLLLLAALFHDMGKGQGRPHEEVGAELVDRQAARMGLSIADRTCVRTVVAQHTTLSRLAARLDPHSAAASDALLAAAHYDPLVLSLLAALAPADAKATGPGVWNPRLESFIQMVTTRALASLAPREHVRPRVAPPVPEVELTPNWEAGLLRVRWRGAYQRAMVRVLALGGALGWTVVRCQIERQEDGSYAAALDYRVQQQTLANAADADYFYQAYKSGTYSLLPGISAQPTAAHFDTGGILEVRTVERVGVLGHLLGALPDVEWLKQEVLGATMVVQSKFCGTVNRTTVVSNVTAALASD